MASDTEGRLYTGGGDGVVSMWAVSTTELRVAKHFDYEVKQESRGGVLLWCGCTDAVVYVRGAGNKAIDVE